MRQTVRRAHLSRHAAGVPTAKHPRLTFLVALLAGCGLIGLLGASGATASTLFIDTTPGCSTVTVPGGVSVLHVDATGTAGMGTAGGAGDEVTADLSGVAGQTLDVCVAQGAGAAGTGTATTGGAGGGASGVGVGVNFSNPLVIGAGGGGGSATNTGGPADLPAGGNGASTDVASGQGGTGGSQGSVGAGGAAEGGGGPGQSGTFLPSTGVVGTGGGGGSGAAGAGGGGGGGGYAGGGGGGSSVAANRGGGGGGGSDYCSGALGIAVSNCLLFANSGTANAQVTLSYASTTSGVSTTVYDSSTNRPWSGGEGSGSSAYDTAGVFGTNGVTPTGNVTYRLYSNGSCSTAPISTQTVFLFGNGVVPQSNSTGPLAVGAYSYQATYSGDSNYFASTGGCEPFSVGFTQATAVALGSSANPAVTGQRVTYTATVFPAPQGGAVTFTNAGVAIAGCGSVPVNLSTDTAVCQTSYPSAGSS
jgi:hypothetical protein